MACPGLWYRVVFVVIDAGFLKDRMGEGMVRRVDTGDRDAIRMD
jgi:hypothetical protein